MQYCAPCCLHELGKFRFCLAFGGGGIMEHHNIWPAAPVLGSLKGKPQPFQLPPVDFLIIGVKSAAPVTSTPGAADRQLSPAADRNHFCRAKTFAGSRCRSWLMLFHHRS